MTTKAKSPKGLDIPTWRQPDGSPVSCLEKIKVLNQNLEEIRQLSQDALEDAVLMGCDEAQIREVFAQMLHGLNNPYRSKK
jgi:hypothetical protein